MKNLERVHVWVTGIVQGVFFRAHTKDTAKHLQITGWVRNLNDGRVEIVAEGLCDDIEKLITWCNKGPPHARVEHVDYKQETATGEFDNFEIRYTY
jgi:acylphosphatase